MSSFTPSFPHPLRESWFYIDVHAWQVLSNFKCLTRHGGICLRFQNLLECHPLQREPGQLDYITRPQLNNKQTKMLLILLFWCFISKRKYFPRTSVCELATQDTAFPLYSLRISIHFTRRQKRSFYICLMETAPSGPPQPKTPLCWLPPALLQAVS